MPNLTTYPYFSQRRVVLGSRGAVATSQPLATLAGMEMLLAGGNAVDAAVAMAIALTVVEPTSNGIGGDGFALVWDGKLHGINASGKSPANLTPNKFAQYKQMPDLGWLSVTVPGAVLMWYELWQKWGKLPFEQLFAPGIRYAEEGFPVSPVTAEAWKSAEYYLRLKTPEFAAFKEVFFRGDRAPIAGEIWASPLHAQTLREIANTGGESFYRGALAEKIVNFASDTGGLLDACDLANHQPLWVEPISTNYRDVTVWEIPPNGQGIAALIALNIVENFQLNKSPRESVESYHRQIEAMKLAYADVYRHVSDPEFMEVTSQQMLDKAYAKNRAGLIKDKAIPLAVSGLEKGGTVYLAAGDGELMVSLIQSNYMGFGSGILVPGTGIALHNRGNNFTLEAGHPNQVGANKRPFHTIIPGFLTRGDQPLGPFGVMGGPMQPQGHLQVVVNLIDYVMNPQAALDAPRWHFVDRNQVLIEENVDKEIVKGLERKGHKVKVTSDQVFGKGQIIIKHSGGFIAGSEPRSDGLALAF